MKKLILAIAGFLSVSTAFGQTTATDFTAIDCNSVSHNLFTDLNNGKVVVLVWVMPCAMCISDAKGAYDAAESFASRTPGKVLYYIVDDMGSTCSALSSWATANGIGSSAFMFDNAGTVIKESDYGGGGMPHVVVIGGGTNHFVYLNVKNGTNSQIAVQNAITAALNGLGVDETENGAMKVNLYPNPATNKLSVAYTLIESADIRMQIMNMVGSKMEVMPTGKQSAGTHTTTINLDPSLSNGVYFLQVSSGSSSKLVKFSIAR